MTPEFEKSNWAALLTVAVLRRTPSTMGCAIAPGAIVSVARSNGTASTEPRTANTRCPVGTYLALLPPS